MYDVHWVWIQWLISFCLADDPFRNEIATLLLFFVFFFQAEDGIRDKLVTGVQTCALPILAPAFVFSGAGYLLVLATLATVGVEGRPRRARPTTIRQDIAEGVAYALHTPEIRAVLGVLFVISFCVFNFSIWVPLLARNVLGQGVQGFGFLLAAVGVGAVCGAFTLGTVVSRRPPLALLDASAAAACSVLLALCVIESVWLAAVALFLQIGRASCRERV